MFKRWECALALRRAASCRKRVPTSLATRVQPRFMSQATPEADLETKAYSQEPPPAYLYPNANAVDWRQKDAALAEHLNTVFSPLQFPPELASRILTHASHPDAKLRHNGRLSFVGRRVLQSYLLMFIHSSPALQAEHDYDAILERALNSYTLGQHVAPRWNIGRVLKWRPMNVGVHMSKPLGPGIEVPTPLLGAEGLNARAIGMNKVYGVAVEAVVGGVFHQFGGSVAHRLFHTRLLPHVCLAGSIDGLHAGYHEHALEICERMGGVKGPLLR